MTNDAKQKGQQDPTVKTNRKNTTVASQKTERSKRRKRAKPNGFKEFEVLAKEIVEANDGSYYEWLHQQHQEIILDFNINNKKRISEVAKYS